MRKRPIDKPKEKVYERLESNTLDNRYLVCKSPKTYIELPSDFTQAQVEKAILAWQKVYKYGNKKQDSEDDIPLFEKPFETDFDKRKRRSENATVRNRFADNTF